MFTSKEKTNGSERFAPNSATLISAGTTVQGDVTSETDLRIDGTIHGNVTSSSKIIIGATGFVEGNLKSGQADINGRIVGNIIVKELLQLRGNCNVQGNISAEKLQVEPTAVFNGQCQMGSRGSASVVEMTTVTDDEQESVEAL